MKHSLLCLILIGAFLVCGCQTKTQTGALTGGLVGTGIGLAAGGGTGALIGAAAGTVGGALIGSALDAQDRDNLNRENPRTVRKIERGEQLSIKDIKAMSRAGIDDSTIIDMINKTDSHYNLTSAQVIDLQKAGVSQRVINYMINA